MQIPWASRAEGDSAVGNKALGTATKSWKNITINYTSLTEITSRGWPFTGTGAGTQALSNDLLNAGYATTHKCNIGTALKGDNNGTNAAFVHRAYPNFHLDADAIPTPCLIRGKLWVGSSLVLATHTLGGDDWYNVFTIATVDTWDPIVTVNLNQRGYLELVHVPDVGSTSHFFQASGTDGGPSFGRNMMQRIDVFMDTSKAGTGTFKVYQNGSLASYATVTNQLGSCVRVHPGLYAAGAVGAGTIYNIKFRAQAVANEAAANELLPFDW